MRLTLQTIAARRLAAQCLTVPATHAPADLVRWCGAVQSQDLPLAKWALGQRLAACTEADVAEALADGSILRTHVLRPTWHFVARDDLRWMLALTARRGIAALGDAVERATGGGVTWIVWRAAAAAPRPAGSAHLLQPFDELVVAYSESRHAVDEAGLVRHRQPDGLLTRSVIVDGQVAGRWRRTLDRRRVLRLDLLRPLTPRQRGAVSAAVERFAAYLGEPLTIETSGEG